jgi:hypothetical protein
MGTMLHGVGVQLEDNHTKLEANFICKNCLNVLLEKIVK